MAEERNPNDPVWMKHKDVAAIGGPVPFHAFRIVWQNKGWTEVSPVLVEASRLLERDVTSLSSLNADDLDAVARNAGFDPDATKNKTELIALLEGNPTAPAVTPGGNA